MTTHRTAQRESRPVSSALRAMWKWSLTVIGAQNGVKGEFAKPRPHSLLNGEIYWRMRAGSEFFFAQGQFHLIIASDAGR